MARAAVEAGAAVVIAARGLERGTALVEELQGAGGVAEFVPTDVADVAAIERLVRHAVDRFGRLDCAINNAAAASGVLARTADFAESEFDEVMHVNVKAVWQCMRCEVRQMLGQDPPGGVIVNTSSVNGLGGAMHGALYSASKAAVLALTKSAAQDYALDGIRVNALVAGAFRTPMLDGVMERLTGDDPARLAELKQRYEAFIPMRRLGTPAEAASAVVWLCSDAASYVTGHSLIVDGGMTAPHR